MLFLFTLYSSEHYNINMYRYDFYIVNIVNILLTI